MSYSIEIENSKTPTNLEQIEKFEELIKNKLPKDYIEFLLQYNGGTPKYKDCYDFIEPIGETEKEGGVHYFYALYDGDVSNIVQEYHISTNRIPDGLIVIASDPCGNEICLCIKGKNYGKVYFWDHENEAPEGEEPWWDNIYLIANSFREFIDKLYEAKLDENNNLVRVDR